jgi:hypothetical protein
MQEHSITVICIGSNCFSMKSVADFFHDVEPPGFITTENFSFCCMTTSRFGHAVHHDSVLLTVEVKRELCCRSGLRQAGTRLSRPGLRPIDAVSRSYPLSIMKTENIPPYIACTTTFRIFQVLDFKAPEAHMTEAHVSQY